MIPSPKQSRGFSLTELLVVMSIVGILALAGALSMGERKTSAVRSLMDELEGALLAAQQNAAVAGTDIPMAAWGNWTSTTAPTTLDGRRPTGAYPSTTADACDESKTPRLGTTSERFVSQFATDRTHMGAGVVTDPTWITTALDGAPALKTVAPCTTEPFLSALGKPLFIGTAPQQNVVRINGVTKRFETGFYIAVVGLAGGNPMPGSAVGMLVVPANSASVYRFYKAPGSTTWVRQ